MFSIFLVSNTTGDIQALPSLVSKKCDKSSPNCSDHKPTQLLINRPVAVPSTCCVFQEFVEDSDMSDVLVVLLEIDLSSHRSIGLLIFTIDPQYNVPSKIIAAWNLSTICARNDLHDICTKISVNCIVSSCLCFLGSPNSNAHALRFVTVSAEQ